MGSIDLQIPRVPPDHPDRCKANMSYGQCNNRSVGVSDYCVIHGSPGAVKAEAKQAVSNYRIGKYQALLERHASSPALKSLRDEVAILRMSLEERLNKCNDTMDLILQSGPISDMVLKIERVVSSCHKLEANMGLHLDKSTLLMFASQVITIIGAHVVDESILTSIADEIIKAVGAINSDPEENDNAA